MSKYAGLIDEYKGFIHILVNQVLKDIRIQETLSVDDLLQEGVRGLLEAWQRFDPERGVKFTTFAAYRVRGSIVDAIRKMQPYDRATYSRMRTIRLKSRVADGMSYAGDEAAHARLSELAGMLVPEVVLAELAGSEENRAIYCPESLYLEDEQRRELARIVSSLPPRERTLVREVYLKERSLAATAAELGLSASWASRLLRRTLDRIRQELEGELEVAREPLSEDIADETQVVPSDLCEEGALEAAFIRANERAEEAERSLRRIPKRLGERPLSMEEDARAEMRGA